MACVYKGTHPGYASPPIARFSTLAGLPSGPERLRRMGVESAVSSSRFRVRDHVPWAHTSVIHGAGYSAVDWDAGRGVLIAGRKNGGLAVMMTGGATNGGVGGGGGGDAPLRGLAPRWGGPRKEEERVLLTAASSRWRSQVGRKGLVSAQRRERGWLIRGSDLAFGPWIHPAQWTTTFAKPLPLPRCALVAPRCPTSSSVVGTEGNGPARQRRWAAVGSQAG